MNYWLMKSEPDCYSIDDLKRDKVEMWDGTRNYQVRNMMRDQMKIGDVALFYHSNAGDETGAVGEMKVVKEAYPDPTQFDPKSDHPDPKSDPENPRWLCVDIRFKSKFKRPIALKEMKLDPKLEGMTVLKKGNRLSVMPIDKKHYEHVVKLSQK
ncbi:MAG: EVE domain-containing protein [Patescibacteria group bacterium]